MTIYPEIFEVEPGVEDYGGGVLIVCDYDWLSVFWEFEKKKTYKFCSLGMPEYSRVQNPRKRWSDEGMIFSFRGSIVDSA